ncbi:MULTISPECIES: 3-hydroxyacyl-CoA dehydrogenase [Halomonadaceae]|jgi:L-gulonate 3-dehydrogenase|uniref:L-carnitine dehydrogenase n=1 Tax=Vreelandella titanicae TaxID=664683 RepID=A0A653QGR0_9GAMM|nr:MULTISPECIES: 3-hydroxyacyl-CoA dehydrogenase [Halomonas]UEQ06092.1 3-hydroxyacyl-CoA dehydrogenase [Halomonas profundus]QKS23187.1 L-carnitine dehydrogenase [Halomonas titanicae]CAD5261644.1 Lambda-crystallin [Halomonas sp. 156]CAD5287353.1 Lambda-crystallin [Halomonas sp. 113]CAD5288881.1 Lambda-crystallin [Halomonas sp. 59]|tara:strand:+ start:2347 stop:3282 length:936 start_codon:yes stop_codon:yes gene_type:complete
MTARIGIIGAGLIGRAWAIVFARSGMSVCLYDVDASALSQVRDGIRQSLQDLFQAGLIEDIEVPLSLIQTENNLAHAMRDVEYVQECGPEDIDAKRRIYSELESVVAIDTVLASSTSGIAASRFTNHLKHPERCLVAHPVNPPYLIPLVEVAPSPDTSEAAVNRTMQLMEQAQQTPILVRKEVQGFILNRLQGALLNEALRLFRDGYVSAEDLDKTVKHGLGLRWSFMGPFETIDLNAPNGVVDYGQRYGPLYRDVDRQRSDDDPWDTATLAALGQERRSQLPSEGLAERQAWRDRRLMALMAHQRHIDTK